MNWYLGTLKKYAVFSGRAQRMEYWMFVLVNFIVSIVLGLFGEIGSLIAVVYMLVVLLPGIAVTVRRLHDIDKSAWWILIALVPFVGSIVLLMFVVLDGTPGTNRFGEDPKDRQGQPGSNMPKKPMEAGVDNQNEVQIHEINTSGSELPTDDNQGLQEDNK